MKKILNYFISLLGFALLVGLLMISINDSTPFLPESAGVFIDFLRTYGAIVIVGLLVFVNIVGKGIVRIIMTVLLLAIAAFYIFATVFPVQFTNLFGIV